MYSAQIESSGKLLELTDNELQWQVLKITGLNPVNATINTTKLAGHDGARFNSASLNMRNIVIELRLNGKVEENRLFLYSVLQSKNDCTFYYQTENRNVKIDGVIENIECDMFTNNEVMQISIICPNPNFQNIYSNAVNISKEYGATEFPIQFPIEFSIYDTDRIATVINPGRDTGFILTVNFYAVVAPVVNPIATKFKLVNEDTSEYIQLDYDFYDGDKLVINTLQGQKSITRYRSNVEMNMLQYMSGTFLQLKSGKNLFSYTPNIATANLTFTTQYGGV